MFNSLSYVIHWWSGERNTEVLKKGMNVAAGNLDFKQYDGDNYKSSSEIKILSHSLLTQEFY